MSLHTTQASLTLTPAAKHLRSCNSCSVAPAHGTNDNIHREEASGKCVKNKWTVSSFNHVTHISSTSSFLVVYALGDVSSPRYPLVRSTLSRVKIVRSTEYVFPRKLDQKPSVASWRFAWHDLASSNLTLTSISRDFALFFFWKVCLQTLPVWTMNLLAY